MAQKKSFNNLGGRIALTGGLQLRHFDSANDIVYGPGIYYGTTFPKSGTAGTTVFDGIGARPGSFYCDTTNDVWFVNEGTAVSPYWTPVSFDQRGLLGWYTDFTKGTTGALVDTTYIIETLGVPHAITETSVTMSDGIRVHGQGMDGTDAGLVVDFSATDGKGAIARLTSSATDADLTCLSVGAGTVPVFQPDQNGTMVIDALVTNVTSLATKAVFVGFSGLGTAALPPLMTYATTVITNVAVDIAGLTWSSELTDNDEWFYVNFDVGAGGTLTTTSVDTGTAVAVAGTYQRLRVEVDADGVMRTFIDKVLESTSAAAAVDVDEELNPQLYIETSTAGAMVLDLRHFYTYGKRV